MTIESSGLSPASSLLRLAALATLFLVASAAMAGDGALPPRTQWKASSSSSETPAMAAPFGIDGDPATRWGGGFSPGHWYQVDLGRDAAIGGVRIQWDTGYPKAYLIEYSDDGKQWRTAFETGDGLGGIEYILFPALHARYLRLAAPKRTADWGVSVFEFEPLAQADAPRIELTGKDNPAALWIGTAARSLNTSGKPAATNQLDIALPRALEVAGLEVSWGDTPGSAKLQGRDAAGRWSTLAEEPEAFGATSYLAANEPHTVTALRMTTTGAQASIKRIRLLGPKRVMTPMKRYETASLRKHSELFPSSLQAKQVYWTAVGIPAGRQKSVFDEYGNLEAFKGAPLVQPLWRDASGHSAAAFAAPLKHRLRAGWMPMPGVQWSPQPGLELDSQAIALEQDGAPVTLVRHRLTNTGTAPIAGRFSLLTRPMQVSPPWQNGGLSPIHAISAEGDAVRVNGRVLFHSLTSVDAQGVAAFGKHGEGEITRHAADGTVPDTARTDDEDGLAAAIDSYDIRLAPGAHRDIVIAFALGKERIDLAAQTLPDSPAIDRAALLGNARDPGNAFDTLSDQVARQWQSRFGRIGLSLPDASLVDMLRAQAAYMLINQSGDAIQPGPRNYNRSFIRDGSATAAVLLRMGGAKTARDYLRWYSDHAVHANGLVSPILNDDGSVNTGFGSDIEYDSQGEFIWLVAEVARLDGGPGSVRDYQAKVVSALKFLQELRERTLVPGYEARREAPERFRGILAPSISHEGYSTPTHSYWDDYWALKGWHDGAWLAEQWGDAATAKWAREQYALLRDSVAASIRATMRWKGSDFIPSSADSGDGDPTGVSIALDPTGQQGILPADALQRTFTRYLDDVRKRDDADALYAYTPYEMRNVLTYVHLDRPDEANELLMNLLRHRRPAEWQVLAEVVYSDLRHPIYLGDMPHTWIGSEYARALFGMLMHEGDERLSLLPGTPPAWVAGAGLGVSDLPTAYGTLSMTARQDGDRLRVTLGPGLRKDTAMRVSWPNRERPTRVTVDGRQVSDYDTDGIRLERPFKELVARW